MSYSFNSNPQTKQFYSVYLRQNVANGSEVSVPQILPPLPRNEYELVAQTKGFPANRTHSIDSSDDGSGIVNSFVKCVIEYDGSTTDVGLDTANFGMPLAEGQPIQIVCSDDNISSITILNCNGGYFSYDAPGTGVEGNSYEVNIVGYYNGTYWEFYIASEHYVLFGIERKFGAFKIGAIKSDMSVATEKETEEPDTEGNLIKLSEKISCSINDMNCTKENYESLRALQGEIDILTVSTTEDKGSCFINIPTYFYLGMSSDDGFITKITGERICRDVDDFFVTY